MKPIQVAVFFSAFTLSLAGAEKSELHQPGGIFFHRIGDLPKPGWLAPAPLVNQRLKEWRVVNGRLESVRGKDWCFFKGKIEQHHDATTVRINGDVYDSFGRAFLSGSFIVINFPTEFADEAKIGETDLFMAKRSELFHYTTVLGGPVQLQSFDYGRPAPVQPPRQPTAAELEAARQARAREDGETAVRVLKFQRDQAEKGSASAQYDLGMRYLKGDGVQKNEVLARAWLEKAALQDDAQAKAALKQLEAHR